MSFQVLSAGGFGKGSILIGGDVRYLVPQLNGNLSVGISGSYSAFKQVINLFNPNGITIQNRYEATVSYVPIFAVVYHRYKTALGVNPFFGAGGGIAITSASISDRNDTVSDSETGLGYGGKVMGGVEYELKLGALTAQLSASFAKSGLSQFIQNLNLLTLSGIVGFRFIL